MTGAQLLRSPEAVAILDRAAKAAGTPLTLYDADQESIARLRSWGTCAACDYVNQHPEGQKRCADDHARAAEKALRRQKPTAIVCHMGFGVLAAPALDNTTAVLVFGPYCPAGEERTLEFDALRGLNALTATEHVHFPVTLNDIHRCPPTLLPAIADWTQGSLVTLVQQGEGACPHPPETSDFIATPRKPLARRKAQRLQQDPQAASQLAAAAKAGNTAQLRAILRMQAAESTSGGEPAEMARIASAVCGGFEAAARSGASTATAWSAFQSLFATARTTQDVLDAGVKALAKLKVPVPKVEPSQPMAQDLLYNLVHNNMINPPSLTEAAKQLGTTPSTLTRRLERQYGVTYSGYVARLRVARAKELLRKPRLSLADVAQRVGIADPSNLARLFRRYEGTTPAVYRAAHGKKP